MYSNDSIAPWIRLPLQWVATERHRCADYGYKARRTFLADANMRLEHGAGGVECGAGTLVHSARTTRTRGGRMALSWASQPRGMHTKS